MNGFLDIRESIWPKPFCDLGLAAMLALEQVSVINDLKGGDAETRAKQPRNNGAALGQAPRSTSTGYTKQYLLSSL